MFYTVRQRFSAFLISRTRAKRAHVAVFLALFGLIGPLVGPAEARVFHVAPGRDGEATIQAAVGSARPGDIIELAPGRYLQNVRSVRNGSPGQPIIIRGPADAVLSGAGASRIFEINHDYIELHGFTIDGKVGDGSSMDSYRDKLLYVIGGKPGDGVTGLRVIGMKFLNAGGECLRLRYFAQKNEVADSEFRNCGAYDFRFNDGGKNGEGVYIGTAPEQLGGQGAPDKRVDHSNDNWVHDNVFDTQGNECVDIKEGSSGNIVERNRCTGQLDPESGGFDSRGNGNVFRQNVVFDNIGAGVRLGGDTASDGIENQVYGNTFRNNKQGALKIQRAPQAKICENVLENNGKRPVTGDYYKGLDPSVSCDEQAGLADEGVIGSEETASAPEEDSKVETKQRAAAAIPVTECPVSRDGCAVGTLVEGGAGFRILRATDGSPAGRVVGFEDALTDRDADPVDPANLIGAVIALEYEKLRNGALVGARIVTVINP